MTFSSYDIETLRTKPKRDLRDVPVDITFCQSLRILYRRLVVADKTTSGTHMSAKRVAPFTIEKSILESWSQNN